MKAFFPRKHTIIISTLKHIFKSASYSIFIKKIFFESIVYVCIVSDIHYVDFGALFGCFIILWSWCLSGLKVSPAAITKTRFAFSQDSQIKTNFLMFFRVHYPDLCFAVWNFSPCQRISHFKSLWKNISSFPVLSGSVKGISNAGRQGSVQGHYPENVNYLWKCDVRGSSRKSLLSLFKY